MATICTNATFLIAERVPSIGVLPVFATLAATAFLLELWAPEFRVVTDWLRGRRREGADVARPIVLRFMRRGDREAFWRDWLDERDEMIAEGRGRIWLRLVFVSKVAWEFREFLRGLFIAALVGVVRLIFF